jgi:hypothetical protein
MTITVTLQQLVDANQALMEMGELNNIPPKAAFAISRVIRKTRDEVRGWAEQRKRILSDLFPAPPKDSKEPVKVKPHPNVPGELYADPAALTIEDNQKIDAALDELGLATVTIEASTLKLAAFGEKAMLKPSWLASLHWLIEE